MRFIIHIAFDLLSLNDLRQFTNFFVSLYGYVLFVTFFYFSRQLIILQPKEGVAYIVINLISSRLSLLNLHLLGYKTFDKILLSYYGCSVKIQYNLSYHLDSMMSLRFDSKSPVQNNMNILNVFVVYAKVYIFFVGIFL